MAVNNELLITTELMIPELVGGEGREEGGRERRTKVWQ